MVLSQQPQSLGESLLSNGKPDLSGSSNSLDRNDVLDESEQLQILAWNSHVPQAVRTCLHHLVADVTEASRQNEAVCAWNGSLTYTQLDRLSSSFAKQMLEAGIGPKTYVPFAFEKSLWAVVATLAILKAGAAFVPLDPTHPRSRLEEISDDVDAGFIVTSEQYGSLLALSGRSVFVVSDSAAQALKESSGINYQLPQVHHRDVAFALFTSGSTGRPKGIIQEHGAVCSNVHAHGKAMGYEKARVLQFAAHTFDVAIMDIFTTLAFGGCVCIPHEEARKLDIAKEINSMRVDMALLTPSFADVLDPSDVSILKKLVFVGEKVTAQNIRRWTGRVNLENCYGPAECGACLVRSSLDLSTIQPDNVGYALENSLCWLVDPENHDALAPIGTVGELLVSGPNLARAYIKNEPKTKTSFIEKPGWARTLGLSWSRYYKTGDLLKYDTLRMDGSMCFVGRKDAQVKVRGQRVETSEVEHKVACVSGISRAAVVFPGTGCFAGELVAVIECACPVVHATTTKGPALDTHACPKMQVLKNSVSRDLPSYMVPTAFILVQAIPVTQSHKIDRKSVNEWVETMSDRLHALSMTGQKDLARLNPNDEVSNAISAKYVELVAGPDENLRSALLGRDFVLQHFGINSIQIIALSHFLQKTLNAKVQLATLIDPELTILRLARAVKHAREGGIPEIGRRRDRDFDEEVGKMVEDVKKEEIPSCELEPVHDSWHGGPEHQIFLTGASGFLGLEILRRALDGTDANVFVLQRCRNPLAGLKQLIHQAREAGWWREHLASRLTLWQGDLNLAYLGLRGPQLGTILNGVTHVIHNGARVHWNSSYEALKPTNVCSTAYILKLAAASRTIRHLTFVSGGQQLSFDMGALDSKCPESVATSSGYSQTKMVAEQVMMRFARSLPIIDDKQLRIVRPSYIIGNPERGNANPEDFIWRMVSTCIMLESFNGDELDRWLFFADVSKVASTVLDGMNLMNMTNGFSTPRDTNNDSSSDVQLSPVPLGMPLHTFWAILSDMGYNLQPRPCASWMGRVRESIEHKLEAHPLFALYHALESAGGYIGVPGKPDFGTAKAIPYLERCVRSNVRHLILIGYLPQPPERHDN